MALVLAHWLSWSDNFIIQLLPFRTAAAAAPASPDTPTQAEPAVSPANQKPNGLGGCDSQLGLNTWQREKGVTQSSKLLSVCRGREDTWKGSDLLPTASLQPQLHSPLSQRLQPCSAAPQKHPCCPFPQCRAAMPPEVLQPSLPYLQCHPTCPLMHNPGLCFPGYTNTSMLTKAVL